MTSAPDRKEIVALIDEAVASGARQFKACAELGLHARTFQRWKSPDGEVREDRRPAADRPAPTNRLTEEERDVIVETCNASEFASLPPSQIVPILADRGTYIGSESSLYRVLRERGQAQRRGRAKPPHRPKPPASFEAKGPCEVWSWDITWLPGPALGVFFYLYMIVDIFSRKIVGWEIHESENAAFAAKLLERAVWAEFLRSLTRRGLRGVQMVISDAHEGLKAAARKVLGAGWQRCRVHFQRNLLARVNKAHKPVVSAVVKTVFAEKERDQAHVRWREVADNLRERFRDVAELMDEAEHDVLAYMAFDESLRSKLHSTNPLERLNKEIKRRTNVIGIFPNREAVIRLVGALMLEQNDEWAVSRRYMPVEKLTAMCNDQDAATMIAAQ